MKTIINKEFLYNYYITENKSIKEIGKILALSPVTIWKRLKEHNIKIKPAGWEGTWNKGLSNKDSRVIAKSTKQAASLKKSYLEGRIKPWNKGLTIEDSRIKKAIEKRESHFVRPRGKAAYTYGFRHTEETKKKLSLIHGGTGIPYEDTRGYTEEFNERLREEIRELYNNRCQICNASREQNFLVYNRELDVHHIDYNKKNSSRNNLIPLCGKCHRRTNFNRNYWSTELKKKIKTP